MLKNKSFLICLTFIIATTLISCTSKQGENISSKKPSTPEVSMKTETNSEENIEEDTNKNEEKKASGLPVILGMDDNVPEAEQEYIDKILSKITKNSTKEEVITLLGEPSRDLGWKLNWWVKINDKNSRVGVFFTSEGGVLEKVVLDGGMGRFYYCKELK